MPLAGIHSVTVPGAVDGWAKMHARFGKLPWADLFAPAIYFAERGFPLTELIQYEWSNDDGKLAADENAARSFCPAAALPRWDRFSEIHELGRAYRILAPRGPRRIL